MAEATKKLQILRNAATQTATDLVAAKTALNGQLARRADGEIIACRYMDGENVKAIIGIVNKGNGTDGNKDSLTFFEGLNVDATGVELPASVQAAINGINDKIDTINGADTVEGSTAKKIKDAIEALDVNDAETEGEFVTAVSETDGKVSVSRKPVAADKVTANAIAKVDGKIAVEGTNVAAQISSIAETIGNLDLAAVGGEGKYLTTVSQAEGKVAAVAAELNAAAVKATAIAGDANQVAVTGTTVEAQIGSLATTLKTVENNAAKYTVVKLSDTEVTALSDSNVKEAYKVVSYVGDFDTAEKTQVGDTIKIYKDASLVSVTPTSSPTGENTSIEFVYNLADGRQETVTIDLGKAIFESEMGNGMKVVDNKIAIKLDAANENAFLTVGEGGLKLSGVQQTINNMVASLDADITSAAEGHKVQVQVVETDGKVSAVNVTENDIASAQALTDEIARATAAEKAAKTEVAGEENFIAVSSETVDEDGHTKYTVAVDENAKNRLGYADNALQTVSVTSDDTALLTASVAEKAGNNGAKTQAITLTPKEATMGSTNKLGEAAVTTNGLVDGDTLAAVLNSIDTIDAGTY